MFKTICVFLLFASLLINKHNSEMFLDGAVKSESTLYCSVENNRERISFRCSRVSEKRANLGCRLLDCWIIISKFLKCLRAFRAPFALRRCVQQEEVISYSITEVRGIIPVEFHLITFLESGGG